MILTLLNYNIWYGGRGREGFLIDVIRSANPDIVLFQEAIHPEVIEQIAQSVNMPFWSARKYHSNGFCSRIEIAHHEWHYAKGCKHGFLELVPAEIKVRLFGVHLRAMFSKWGERRRVFEIEALLHEIKREQRGFHILSGDFNSLAPDELLQTTKLPPWIRALVWLSGRDLQRDTVKLIKEHGYVDAFRKLHPDDKGYTFPTNDPHVRLDYVFVPEDYKDRFIECKIIDQSPAPLASDHFPLLSRFNI